MSDRRRPRLAALLSILAVLAALAAAPGASALELRPGLWEFQVTVQGGLMGNQILTQKQCLRGTELDPSLFMTQLGLCSIGESRRSAGRLSFDFDCDLQGVKSAGSGSMAVVGDAVRGRVTRTMAMPGSAGGRQFTLDDTWAGRRLGECF